MFFRRLMASLLILLSAGIVHAQVGGVGELSSNSVRKYQEDFFKSDADENGVLDQAEVETYLVPFPAEIKTILFQKLKARPGETKVTLADLLDAATLTKKQIGYDPRASIAYRIAFEKRYDANQDGKLDAEEVEQMGPPDLREIVKKTKLAANPDGVPFDQFMEAFGDFIRITEIRRALETSRTRMFPADIDLLKSRLAQLTQYDQPAAQAKVAEAGTTEAETSEKEPAVSVLQDNPHRDYFATFDTNGDGKLSGEEFERLPNPVRRQFEPRIGEEASISFEQFHDFLELLRDHEARFRAERERQEKESQAEADRERQFRDYIQQRSQLPEEDVAVDLQESPHRDYFRDLDSDGNGLLQGEELKVLSPRMTENLSRRYPVAWSRKGVTLAEFHQFWEERREGLKLTRKKQQEEQRYTDHLMSLLPEGEAVKEIADAVKAPDEPKSDVVEVPRVRRAPPAAEKEAASAVMAVDVVLLKRTVTSGLPYKTLTEEIEPMLKMDGPSIPTRMVKWMEKPGHEAIGLSDYFQVKATAGEQIQIQQGSREPSQTSSSGRGANYSLLNVGTLISVLAKPIGEESILVHVDYEKSYIVPGQKVEKEEPTDEPKTEERRPATTREEFEQAIRGGRGFGGTPDPNFVPDSIATLTAAGSVQLRPGKPVVLTEVGRMKGDQFEEIVIVVEWK
ncbi:hypothetical protein AB1L30_25915 [Bremerella sp. JC817]|uniref:hypothetical protein n=1 Tax=Bremerella sp. JC817 TaxID=3231756 RepID=UPI00345AA918